MGSDVSKLGEVFKKTAAPVIDFSKAKVKNALNPEQLKGLAEAIKKFKGKNLKNDKFQKIAKESSDKIISKIKKSFEKIDISSLIKKTPKK